MKYKYIFIDLDDTIWDFHANAKEAIRDIYHQEKLDNRFDDFDVFYHKYAVKNVELWTKYGQGLIDKDFLVKERFRHLLLEAGINDDSLALKMNSDYLDMLATKKELKSYAIEFLNFCREHNLSMTIVSNGFTEVQYRKLKNAGIEHYFDHVVLSEEAGALKPDPIIFQYAMNLNKSKPEEILMIGDSFDADIVGAVGVGIDALFLNDRGINIDIPEGVKEIKSLKEAQEIIIATT
ncbi:MAG: YjjG family noncanonical pyrimidine nucleotidase [Paludibacteraceae bacterium]